MKTRLLTSIFGKTGLITAIVFAFGISLDAQSLNTEKINLKENALKNLISGINHENDGVRKSAIYFAGKYRISESVDALVSQLENEENSSFRVLISLSLFMIGDENGMDAIYRTSLNDPNEKVKRMASAIYAEYQRAKNNMFAARTDE